MTNENEKKIEQIRGYLAQANCAGVEVEYAADDTTRKIELAQNSESITVLDCMSYDLEQGELSILSIKPIPIELEQIKERDNVWAGGKIGTVTSLGDIERYTGEWFTEYEVYFDAGGRDIFERHELLKVVG